jgi:hypothetical protein
VAGAGDEAGGGVGRYHHHHLTLRSGPQGRVSKGGQQHDWLPPFETHRFAVLLRVRLSVSQQGWKP